MKKRLIVTVVVILISLSITSCSKYLGSAEKEQAVKEKISEKAAEQEKGDISKDAEKNDTESKEKEKIEYELTAEGIIKPEDAKKIIKEKSDLIIYALSQKDALTVSGFVHPDKGVRFTPYTHVSTDSDVVFDSNQMKNFFDDKKAYVWGIYDGKGDEISLTPSEYYDKFIYYEDFINAEKIGYNEVLSSGNMAENQFETYKNAIVVEYYFSGFNPDYGGADWQSLRLVFEEYENNWKLVGIIHNQWTT